MEPQWYKITTDKIFTWATLCAEDPGVVGDFFVRAHNTERQTSRKVTRHDAWNGLTHPAAREGGMSGNSAAVTSTYTTYPKRTLKSTMGMHHAREHVSRGAHQLGFDFGPHLVDGWGEGGIYGGGETKGLVASDTLFASKAAKEKIP